MSIQIDNIKNTFVFGHDKKCKGFRSLSFFAKNSCTNFFPNEHSLKIIHRHSSVKITFDNLTPAFNFSVKLQINNHLPSHLS